MINFLNNSNMEVQISTDKQKNKQIMPIDPFRKSQLKQSQIILGVCCSRHLQCINIGNDPSPYHESDSLSVNSDLLQEFEQKNISSDPLFQFQSKPEIDLLAQINIKKKKYQQILQQQLQQELQKEQKKKQNIEQLNLKTKKIIEKCEKVPQTHKNKWGHTIFTLYSEKEKSKEKSKKPVKSQESPQKQKIKLKPIGQRIAEYKQKQLMKTKSEQNLKRPAREGVNVQECNEKIKENAEKILQQMKKKKEQEEQQQKIINAKIRALQMQGLKKASKSKKKPLDPEVQFNLGDSQYSTFSARAEGRKIQKKPKKQKQTPNLNPSLLQTKKSKTSKAASRQPSNRSKKNIQKTVQKNKAEETNKQVEKISVQPETKGPVYIWNMPILPEDIAKLQKKSKDVFMNVDRFNYKTGKTFREEANQFLAQKMSKKMEEESHQTKQQTFWNSVASKKQQLLQQFAKQNNPIVNEPFWNQDQMFKPNILSNFHFFSKEH